MKRIDVTDLTCCLHGKFWQINRLLVWLVAMLASGAAHAGCSVSSSGLAFGAYQPLTVSGSMMSSDRTSDASIAIVCTGISVLSSYTLALGPSTTGAGDRISNRYLSNTSGGADMLFNVYTTPLHTTVWGNGSAGNLISGVIPISLDSQTQSVTVYGRIPGGQATLRAGSFSGSLLMTLTYNP